MSNQPVNFVYGADTEAAVRAVDDLTQSMERNAGVADESGQSIEGLEQNVSNLRQQTDELRDSQDDNARSHQTLSQQFEAAGRSAQTLAQRVQGTAGAVQALVAATGSDDRTAGAIASMAGLTAQGAAAGTMFGPGGTALGAIVGFTAAILSMASAQDTAAEAAANHRRELEQLAAANMAEADRSAFAREVETGNIGAGRSDAVLTREREIARIELNEFESSWDELRERIRTTRETYAGLGRDVPADTERVLLAEVNALRRSREERLDVITVIDGEIAGRRQLHEMEAAHRREAEAARGRGGGGGARPRTIDDILGVGAANNADMAAIAGEAEARAAERAGEAKEREEAAEFEVNEAKRVAQLNLDRELLAAEDERRHQRRLEQTRREAEASRRADDERRRRAEQEQRILTDFGGAVGNVFGQAFGAAIQGQESFDQALLKGTKQALIQYGTTMVAEGAGALLTAAGNVILNPPAAASKAIEGAGKVALGVGLGATGAAIQLPAAAGDSSSKAERPQNQTPASNDGGYNSVVIMNSPVIAGGHAEFGRLVNRGQRAAAQRFGRAA